MRQETRAQIAKRIRDGLGFPLDEEHFEVQRVQHGLKVVIRAHETGDGRQVPAITVMHKDPGKLVKKTTKSIVEALSQS